MSPAPRWSPSGRSEPSRLQLVVVETSLDPCCQRSVGVRRGRLCGIDWHCDGSGASADYSYARPAAQNPGVVMVTKPIWLPGYCSTNLQQHR